MWFWIWTGMLTAIVTGLVIAPLGKENRALALVLMILIPAFALGLYFLGGNPELAK